MANAQDAQLGIAVESVPKTFVAPTRFLEWADDGLDWTKGTKQGMGIRVGARGDLSNRRTNPSADGGGPTTIPWVSKGLGLLLQACMGSSASALVSGSTFQQLHQFGDNPSTLTVQKGIWNAGSGAVDPISLLGCAVSGFEIDFPNVDNVSIKPTFDAADISTSQSLATASYPAEPVTLFQFAGGSISNGALTLATGSALASAATPVLDIRGGSLTVNNNIRDDRYNFGGAGRKSKQFTGKRQITGSLDIEYDSQTFRDAMIADTELTLLLTWTGAALSTGTETLQIAIPAVKFDTELVKANGTDMSVMSMGFTGLLNTTAAQMMQIVVRTADAAL